MSAANNILTGVIVAPFIFLMAAVSLSSLQRGIEWVTITAKSTSLRGWMRVYVKPACKNVATVLERILGGNKITVTPTNVLLMAILIVLFALLLSKSESNEKSKKSASKGKKD